MKMFKYGNGNPFEDDNCVKCGKDSPYACEECGASYCSTVCQVADWRNHRYICVKVPKLIPVSMPKSIKIATNHALIEFENNFNTLKLHEKCNSDEIRDRRDGGQKRNVSAGYIESQQQSNNAHNSLSRSGRYRHEQHGKNNLQLQNNDVKKRFGNGGQQQQQKQHNSEHSRRHGEQKRNHQYNKHDKKDLQKSNNIGNAKQGQSERQSDIDNAGQRRHSREQNNNQEGENQVAQQYFNDDQSRCSFEDQNRNQENYSGNQQINHDQVYEAEQQINDENQKALQPNENELPHQNDEPNSNAPVLKPPFEINRFSENSSNFEAFVVDITCINDGIFACIPYSDCASFINMQSFLAKIEKDGEPYKPVLNEYCVALFDGEWYRAKVIDAKENQIKVEYIDYGNEAHVKMKDIRRYPADLTHVCSTNKCKLAGLPDKLCSNLLNQLKKMIDEFQKVYVKSVKKNDEICEIECPVLLKELSELGFI